MKKADLLIKRCIRKFYIRRKFRKVIYKFIHVMKIKIYKIQRSFKRIYRKKKIMIEINKRIQKKKEEAERQKKIREERERIERMQKE